MDLDRDFGGGEPIQTSTVDDGKRHGDDFGETGSLNNLTEKGALAANDE
jgi:hypothetical protein